MHHKKIAWHVMDLEGGRMGKPVQSVWGPEKTHFQLLYQIWYRRNLLPTTDSWPLIFQVSNPELHKHMHAAECSFYWFYSSAYGFHPVEHWVLTGRQSEKWLVECANIEGLQLQSACPVSASPSVEPKKKLTGVQTFQKQLGDTYIVELKYVIAETLAILEHHHSNIIATPEHIIVIADRGLP